MRLPDDVLQAADDCVLVWLATTDDAGQPNVSPKEMFGHVDGRLVIANIASPHTVANIRGNPQVCASFVDVFAERGWKVHGTARLVAPTDADFDRVGADLVAAAGPRFPIRHVIHVEATRWWPIVSPSHHLLPDRSDEQRRSLAHRRYGVQPREAP